MDWSKPSTSAPAGGVGSGASNGAITSTAPR
jgi:hypothetical protein